MSIRHLVAGGEIVLLPEAPRKDGKGTFPASVKIATTNGKLMIPLETWAGILDAVDKDPELRVSR